MDKQIVVYEGEKDVRLEVKTDGETVWLTQEQMCQLFGRTQPVIARHIANVFKEGELPKEGFMQILHKTSQVGGRPIAIYNLDVVISVGYRVKSFQGTRFRQWATRVLREMLLNRLDEVKRIGNLERRMAAPQADRLWRWRRIDRQAVRQEMILSTNCIIRDRPFDRKQR